MRSLPLRPEPAFSMMFYMLTQPGSKPASRGSRTTRTFGFQRTKSRVLARWRALERRLEFQEARAFFLHSSLFLPRRSRVEDVRIRTDQTRRRLFRFNSRFTPSRSTRPVLRRGHRLQAPLAYRSVLSSDGGRRRSFLTGSAICYGVLSAFRRSHRIYEKTNRRDLITKAR